MTNGKSAPLVSGEQTILASDNGTLSLTNYRVKFDAKASGQTKYVSISLDSVSSCGLVTRSRPALLAIAAICGVLAVAVPDSSARIGLILVGVAFSVGYFVTRSAVINISSDGGEGITVPAKGMAREQIVAFLEAITIEKLKFSGKIGQ